MPAILMNNVTYHWDILNVYKISNENMTDFIYRIEWKFTAIYENISSSVTRSTIYHIDRYDPESFISFEEARTSGILVEWVKRSLNRKGQFELKKLVDNDLIRQANLNSDIVVE